MLKRRTPWVFVLAVAVLLGALDLHPAGEWHNPFDTAEDGSYSHCAQGPHAPRHLEQFQAGQRPLCPYCLHQLRTGGAHLAAAALLATPSMAGFRGLVSTPLLRERCAAPRGARGPPSA